MKTKNSIAECNTYIKGRFYHTLLGARERCRSCWVLEENIYLILVSFLVSEGVHGSQFLSHKPNKE